LTACARRNAAGLGLVNLRVGTADDVARLLSRNGVAAITAAISPYRAVRDEVRAAHASAFIEVYVRCPLEELTRRDVKGLYAKALRGEIANFTGVSDPYEEPLHAEVVVDSSAETVEESAARILEELEALGYLERVEVAA